MKLLDDSIALTEDYAIFTETSLKTSYKHETFNEFVETEEGIRKVERSCISKWLRDSSIRKYEDVGIYPDPKKCPKNILNLWKPFAMEKVLEWVDRSDAVEMFLNHIKVLSGNSQEVADYIIKWIAQMILYPEMKTICPTFIGNQGTGKGLFLIF